MNEVTIPLKIQGIAQMKAELRELKGSIASATDPAQMAALAQQAGVLSDRIKDANEAVAVFATGSKFRSAWTAATLFRIGDVVVYGGNTYQCILEHTSAASATGIIAGNNDAADDSTLETWTYLLENDKFIVADDMGLGKTVQALSYLEYFKKASFVLFSF